MPGRFAEEDASARTSPSIIVGVRGRAGDMAGSVMRKGLTATVGVPHATRVAALLR
jgi:hypothetical protein